MGFWTNSIEMVTAADNPHRLRFYIASTETDYDFEVTDICEPAASAGLTFPSEFAARMFAAEHGIGLACDSDFEDACQREFMLRRDGMTEAQMIRYIRSLGPTSLRSEAQSNPFAYDEQVRRDQLPGAATLRSKIVDLGHAVLVGPGMETVHQNRG